MREEAAFVRSRRQSSAPCPREGVRVPLRGGELGSRSRRGGSGGSCARGRGMPGGVGEGVAVMYKKMEESHGGEGVGEGGGRERRLSRRKRRKGMS